jgi:hypothetical protein
VPLFPLVIQFIVLNIVKSWNVKKDLLIQVIKMISVLNDVKMLNYKSSHFVGVK